MAEDTPFKDLIRQIRRGDDRAAAELVQRYERVIRRTVRIHLQDPHLERVLDSMDICQSVLGSFFVRMNLGQFEIESPHQLLKLLTSMARNKLNDQARKFRTQRRDIRLLKQEEEAHLNALPAADATPSRILLGKELLARVQSRLLPEEWYLAEQRAQGRAWSDLAAELGRTPDALRKQLERAIERVTQELGLDDQE